PARVRSSDGQIGSHGVRYSRLPSRKCAHCRNSDIGGPRSNSPWPGGASAAGPLDGSRNRAICVYSALPEPLQPDSTELNQTVVLSLCLSMIFSENRFPLFRIMLWPGRRRLQCRRALAFDRVNPSAKDTAVSRPLPLPSATTAGRLRVKSPRAAFRVD